MMSTSFDSTADAAEASEALRGLAHASPTFDQPAQMYGVIGDLSSGMRSLHRVPEQLADVHKRKSAHAFNDDDDGDHAAGVRDALATAEELRRSARLVDQAHDRLAEGFVASGRIAWHPQPAIEESVPSRWVNVTFLQGDEADRPLRILGVIWRATRTEEGFSIPAQREATRRKAEQLGAGIVATPLGMLLHGIMSTIAEFYSRSMPTSSASGSSLSRRSASASSVRWSSGM